MNTKYEENPRHQCCVCGKWRRIHLLDGDQSVYGGDSTCGDICVECAKKMCLEQRGVSYEKEDLGNNPLVCPKEAKPTKDSGKDRDENR